MSLEAFEHWLRTILREVLSQYPLASAVVRPGPGRPAVRRPPSDFGLSMTGSSSGGSVREMSSVLELEPTVGELSSVPEPEGADGVGPEASPVRLEEPRGSSTAVGRHVRASPSK